MDYFEAPVEGSLTATTEGAKLGLLPVVWSLRNSGRTEAGLAAAVRTKRSSVIGGRPEPRCFRHRRHL